MELATNIGWVILGLVFLYYGAEWLVQGAARIAMMFGLSSLVVGLTIVAFGTSAPELVVSVQANWHDHGDFALGNVIGSNICNIGLVLGIAAIIVPIVVHEEFIKRELPLLVGVSIAMVAALWDQNVSRFEGALFVVGIIAYSAFCIHAARKNPTDPNSDGDETDDDEMAENRSQQKQLVFDIGLILVGLIILAVGANRLVAGGEYLATALGVSDAVIALTLVALGTSLPELATTVVACLKGESDMAAGNAIGSCLFNILCVLGITAIIKPVVSTSLSAIDLAVMVAFAIATHLLMRNDRELGRLDGILLLIGYVVYIVSLGFRQVPQ